MVLARASDRPWFEAKGFEAWTGTLSVWPMIVTLPMTSTFSVMHSAKAVTRGP
jgi:hypothetical protein